MPRHRHTRFRTQPVNSPHYYNGASSSRMPRSSRWARRGAAGVIDARARVAFRHTRDIAGICADEPSRVAYLRATRPRAGPRNAHDARPRLHRAGAITSPRDAATRRAFGRETSGGASPRAPFGARAVSHSSGLDLKFEAGNPLLTDIWGPSNGTRARARSEETRAPARVAFDRVDHGVRARETDARRSRPLASAFVAVEFRAIPTIAAQRPRRDGNVGRTQLFSV